MAKGRNCPNCGAPYDPNEPKCPYCGTIYYDMSAINFDDGEPIYLQIKTNDMVIMQKVIPQLGGIEITHDALSFGSYKVTRSCCVNTSVSFQSVADTDGTIMKIIAYERNSTDEDNRC